MTALLDCWFIGDNFLLSIFDAFMELRKVVVIKRRNQPYLFDFFNVLGYFQSKASMVRGIVRMLNAFIDALNTRKKLPRFIIFVPDRDLITQVNYPDFGASEVFEHCIEWLVKQVNILIQ